MRILGLIAALVLCWATVSAEKLAKPGADPIQAELMADLHARLLKVGGTIYARVTVEWRSPTCILKNGAVLEAHVVSVVPSIKPAKASEVGVAFTKAQCGDLKMGPLNLLLSAIAAPLDDSDLGNLSENLPVRAMSGESGQIVLNSMRLDNDQIAPSYLLSQIPRMEVGDVYHIKGLKLSVGTGPTLQQYSQAGQQALAAGHYDEAESDFKKLLEIDPIVVTRRTGDGAESYVGLRVGDGHLHVG
jgi:hypothetical protein